MDKKMVVGSPLPMKRKRKIHVHVVTISSSFCIVICIQLRHCHILEFKACNVQTVLNDSRQRW